MAMAVITIARSFSSLLPSLGVSRKWSSQYKAGKSVSWALKCEGREVCEAKSVGIEAGIRAGYQQRRQEEGADSGPVTVEKETSAKMFVDASHQIAFNPSRMHYGVCVADLNNDGKMEFFVCGFADQNQLLKWTGTELVNIANGTPLEDPSSSSIGVAAGDFDGDGSEELYVLNTDTFLGRKKVTDRLFDHQEGRWVDLFALPRNMDDSNMCAGRSVCAVDRMGTGKYGFFVANYGGFMKMFEMSEEGFVGDVAGEVGLVTYPTGGRALVSLPLISQCAMDIFAGNES